MTHIPFSREELANAGIPTDRLHPHIAVVVPTNRPERIAAWWEAWAPQLAGCNVIVVHDAPELPHLKRLPDTQEVSWVEIDADLGHDAWIIPRRTDCIRSYGFLLAHRAGADIIMTMDDDCLPVTQENIDATLAKHRPGVKDNPAGDPPGWVEGHRDVLSHESEEDGWISTLEQLPPRGLPYGDRIIRRPIVLSHGLWRGVLDLDAVTRIARTRSLWASESTSDNPIRHFEGCLPRGAFFPMCGMNVAFRRELMPAMYFGLMGRGPERAGRAAVTEETFDTLRTYPFDRWGDMAAGLHAKKICDHLGLSVHSGEPRIVHDCASDAGVNLRKEAAAIVEWESWWRRVDAIRLKGETAAECYLEVAAAVGEWKGEYESYWRTLSEAMRIWVRLLEK